MWSLYSSEYRGYVYWPIGDPRPETLVFSQGDDVMTGVYRGRVAALCKPDSTPEEVGQAICYRTQVVGKLELTDNPVDLPPKPPLGDEPTGSEGADDEPSGTIAKDYRGADLVGDSLNGASLAGVDFTGADLSSASLVAADLRGANFTDAEIMRTDFTRANLTGAQLVSVCPDSWGDSNLPMETSAKFIGAILVGADLSAAPVRANLSECDFRNANLTGANLQQAWLEEADLRNADLTNADLSGAWLEWANLAGATLVGTRLDEVVLEGVDLCGADLSWTELTGVGLSGARHDQTTTWPVGFRPPPSAW